MQRLTIYLPNDLAMETRERAATAGQPVSTYVARALSAWNIEEAGASDPDASFRPKPGRTIPKGGSRA